MYTIQPLIKNILPGLFALLLFHTSILSQGNEVKARIMIGKRATVFTGANSNSSFMIQGGKLSACGDNSFGQLGAGKDCAASSRSLPVGQTNEWTMLAAGSFHTIALKKDGSLWSWGDNQYGQLGDGSVQNNNAPKQLPGAEKWIMVAAADYQSFAIKNDGSLWAWGVNNYGQLGTGADTDFINKPQQVGKSYDWVSVSAGSFHTLALKKDGTLWAWGYGADGQLGLGHTASVNTPVQVGSSHDWMMISAAGFHSFALGKDGCLWAWGDNEYGVLGIGDKGKQTAPVKLSGGNDWKTVSSGFHHTAAIKTDGSLWTWGNNFNGELGHGKAGAALMQPMQVGPDKNWEYVIPGYAHTLAVKQDQTHWAWGQNEYGQLGTGDLTSRTVPVQLVNATTCDEELPPAR